MPIDLSRSIPPLVAEVGDALRAGLQELAAEPAGDLGAHVRTAPFGGSDIDKSVAAGLLAARWRRAVDARAMIVGNGTQNLLSLLLEEIVGPGGLLLAERLTYSMLPSLVARARVEVRGVDIDENGLHPSALEDACRRCRPKAIFCNPTVHNPTTSIMPLGRRREIVAIAERYGVALIEDDVLGFLHPEAPPPLAAIAPQTTWYLMGLTKCIAHGMRIAYLVAPDQNAAASLSAPVQAMSSWSASPISLLVLRHLAATDHLQTIFAGIRAEATARQEIATRYLGAADIVREPASLHLWLRLPAGVSRHGFVREVEAHGVVIRPSDRFSVDGNATPEAVRLSLSSPATRIEVETGLSKVGAVLRSLGVEGIDT